MLEQLNPSLRNSPAPGFGPIPFNTDVEGANKSSKEYTIELIKLVADITEITDDILKGLQKECCDIFISRVINILRAKDIFEIISIDYPFNSRNYIDIFHQQNMYIIVGNNYSIGTLLKSSASNEYKCFDIISCNSLGYNCVVINPKRLGLIVKSITLTINSKKLKETDYNLKIDGKYNLNLSSEELQEYLYKKEVIVTLKATISVSVTEDKVGIYFSWQ